MEARAYVTLARRVSGWIDMLDPCLRAAASRRSWAGVSEGTLRATGYYTGSKAPRPRRRRLESAPPRHATPSKVAARSPRIVCHAQHSLPMHRTTALVWRHVEGLRGRGAARHGGVGRGLAHDARTSLLGGA